MTNLDPCGAQARRTLTWLFSAKIQALKKSKKVDPSVAQAVEFSTAHWGQLGYHDRKTLLRMLLSASSLQEFQYRVKLLKSAGRYSTKNLQTFLTHQRF